MAKKKSKKRSARQAPNNKDFNFVAKPEVNKSSHIVKTIVPKTIPSPTQVYTANVGKSRSNNLRWESPEWDLAECGRIIDVESIVRRAFRNKRNLFLKEGYGFISANPERAQYIKERFFQFSHATKIPINTLITQTIASLIRTSNAYWIKVRDEKVSGGKTRIDNNNKTIKPVAGYFIAPTETMKVKRDSFGNIKKWAQEVYGKEPKEFRPEDVIHFYFDRREGFSVGTPTLVSVKDDIRALRRIEENLELLIYQHLFPLFHYTVGTPDRPAEIYPDGTSEVDEVVAKVARMPSDGCWVTPERHSIEAVGAKGAPVAVDKVIEHFKQRIYTGLGNSSVDMGEGGSANRSTAQTMSRNLIDDTKADQLEFAAQFNQFVIEELLQESSFPEDTLFLEENKVSLSFNEIDFESKLAKENHYVDLFLKNAITHSEMRQNIGMEPFRGKGWTTGGGATEEWQETNYGSIERDKIVLQSIDEPGTEESKSLTKSAANKSSNSSGGESISNKNTPENQHGIRLSSKVNRDSYVVSNYSKDLAIIENQGLPIQNTYSVLINDVNNYINFRGLNTKELSVIIDSGLSKARDRLTNLCKQAFRIGIKSVDSQIWLTDARNADGKIQDHVNRYVLRFSKQLIDAINNNIINNPNMLKENILIINSIFKSFSYRTIMIDNEEIIRAYNYGQASGYLSNNCNEIKIEVTETSDCKLCKPMILKYNNFNDIIYEELPPLHPHCICKLKCDYGLRRQNGN